MNYRRECVRDVAFATRLSWLPPTRFPRWFNPCLSRRHPAGARKPPVPLLQKWKEFQIWTLFPPSFFFPIWVDLTLSHPPHFFSPTLPSPGGKQKNALILTLHGHPCLPPLLELGATEKCLFAVHFNIPPIVNCVSATSSFFLLSFFPSFHCKLCFASSFWKKTPQKHKRNPTQTSCIFKKEKKDRTVFGFPCLLWAPRFRLWIFSGLPGANNLRNAKGQTKTTANLHVFLARH